MSLADKITYALQSKELIKDAIIHKKATVTPTEKLRDYPQSINSIPTGSGPSPGSGKADNVSWGVLPIIQRNIISLNNPQQSNIPTALLPQKIIQRDIISLNDLQQSNMPTVLLPQKIIRTLNYADMKIFQCVVSLYDDTSLYMQLSYDYDTSLKYNAIAPAHTDNLSSREQTSYSAYGDNVRKTFKYSDPNISGYDVDIKYQTESTNYDWVCIYANIEPTDSNYNNSISGKLGGSLATKQYHIEGNTMYIYFRSDGSASNYFGFWADITPTYITPPAPHWADTILPIPEKEGYTFIGWYQDAELTIPVTSDIILTSAKQFYAKWERS